MSNTFRLVISCPDRVGIVAAVSQYLHERNGSIIEANHHTDPEQKWFFMRHVIDADSLTVDIETFRAEFATIAAQFDMNWYVTDSRDKPKVMLMATKESHCLNDILHRCLQSAQYVPDGVIPSISPSMDIQVSSNFERALYYAYGCDGAAVAQLMDELKAGGFAVSQGALQALRETFDSGRCDEAETAATITRLRASTGEVLCPHTAVGVKVAEQHLAPGVPMITLATAHPAKFPQAVEAATGLHPALPPRMADLFDRPERVTPVANDLAAIETLISERITA